MFGGVPEWPKGSDCKSDGSAFGGSNPPPSTISLELSSVARLGRMRAGGSLTEPRSGGERCVATTWMVKAEGLNNSPSLLCIDNSECDYFPLTVIYKVLQAARWFEIESARV